MARTARVRWWILVSIGLACAAGAIAATPQLVLTPRDPIVDLNGTTVLSWAGSGVSTCTASGAWKGDMPVTGEMVIGPLDRKTTYSLECSGKNGSVASMVGVVVLDKVLLSWTAPDMRVNGTAYANADGFRLYYGTQPGVYSNSVRIWNTSAFKRSLLLPSDTYYFALTAIDLDGLESPYSNEVVRIVK
jgi:hypothetical protein